MASSDFTSEISPTNQGHQTLHASHSSRHPNFQSSSILPVTRLDVTSCDWGWIVVLAAFYLHCVIDGCCHSFLIFYMDFIGPFKESSPSLVVLLPPAMYLLVGPLMAILTKELGCRTVTVAGSLLSTTAIFASAYVTSIDTLIVTYGVIGGIGFGMMYFPSLIIVSLYFERHRGLATGFSLTGSALSTFIFNHLTRYLIRNYGWAGTNQLLAGLVLHGVVCGVVYRPLDQFSTRATRDVTLMSQGYTADSDDSSLPYIRGKLMRRIATEKRRLRSESTGSLDGTIITHDNRLIRPSDRNDSDHTLTSPVVHNISPTEFDCNTIKKHCKSVSLDTSYHEIVRIPMYDEVHHSSTIWIKSESFWQHHDYSKAFHISQTLPAVDPMRHKKLAVSDSLDSNMNKRSSAIKHQRLESDLSGRLERLLSNTSDETPGNLSVSNLNQRTSKIVSDFDLRVTLQDPVFINSARIATLLSSILRRIVANFALLKAITFYVICIGVIVPFLGFFTPFSYLAPYAIQQSVVIDEAVLLMSVIGVTNAAGRILMGFLSDRSCTDSVLLYNVSLIAGGLVTCLVPLLKSYELLFIYAALFGLCVASFVALKSIVLIELFGIDNLISSFGLVCLFQGFATLFGLHLTRVLYSIFSSTVSPFVTAGLVILVGGVIGLPIRRLARWEVKRLYARNELNEKLAKPSNF